MNKNISNWDDIYSNKKAGSFLHYPNENLVTLFFQNKQAINLNGRCLDYGFGSANNTEFLIQHIHEIYGIEISESSLDIANNRLAKFKNFRKTNFFLWGKEPDLAGKFDLIVAWQVLYYNDKQGLLTCIEKMYDYLVPGGVLMCTMITPRDVKVKNAQKIDSNVYVIDKRIPTQEGCLVFSSASEKDFLLLFNRFDVLDHGYYERSSSLSGNVASEYYLVAKKK